METLENRFEHLALQPEEDEGETVAGRHTVECEDQTSEMGAPKEVDDDAQEEGEENVASDGEDGPASPGQGNISAILNKMSVEELRYVALLAGKHVVWIRLCTIR